MYAGRLDRGDVEALGELGVGLGPALQIASFAMGLYGKAKAKKEAKKQGKLIARDMAIQYVYSTWPQYMERLMAEVGQASEQANMSMMAMRTATGPVAVRLGEGVRKAHAKVIALMRQYEGGAMTFRCCGVPYKIVIGGMRVKAARYVPTGPMSINPHRWSGWWPVELRRWAQMLWDQAIGRVKELAADLTWTVKMIPTFAVHVKAPVAKGMSHTVFVQPPPRRPGFSGLPL